MIKKQVVIIGSGFAGLSAACFLARDGYAVTVLEKNTELGGRARLFEVDGFRFDMGPSWYWMPDVFEAFFKQFGKKTQDFYELVRLSPAYRVFFSESEKADIPASYDELLNLFEQYEEGAGAKLAAFLLDAGYKYEVGINDFVYRPSRSIFEFFDWRFFKGLLQLDLLTSLRAFAQKFFKNEKLLKIIEFPVLFLGATPDKTPAMYSLMNYADLVLGTWYPKGGMNEIIRGMVQLAGDLGVEFRTEAEVESVEVFDKKITHVALKNGKKIAADVVVAGADYHHVEQQILPAEHRQYSEAYWEKRTMAPSSLLFYLGIDTKIAGLLHHNLFFDENFDVHACEIYENPMPPSRPLFYACCPSKTDQTVAPEGCENLFLLLPIAPDLPLDEAHREHYFTLMLDKLERYTGQNIRKHIVFKRAFAKEEFMTAYNSFKGNAYGLANTLRQTALLKPTLKSAKISNLYYTGQLTVPGPGVPPSIISGQVVAREIHKIHRF